MPGPANIRIGPAAYDPWPSTQLGRITEAVEQRLSLWTLGPLAGARVLDVGCGDGPLLQAMAEGGARVTGVNPDLNMPDAARARAAWVGLPMTLLAGRAERLPFPGASFDAVCAVTVLCFVVDPANAIHEMAHVLRSGGRPVLGELARWNLWAAIRRIKGWAGSSTWSAARFRSAGELRRLLEGADLKVSEIRDAVYFPPVGALARLTECVDPWRAQMTTLGAAFIAIRGERSGRAP